MRRNRHKVLAFFHFGLLRLAKMFHQNFIAKLFQVSKCSRKRSRSLKRASNQLFVQKFLQNFRTFGSLPVNRSAVPPLFPRRESKNPINSANRSNRFLTISCVRISAEFSPNEICLYSQMACEIREYSKNMKF